MTIDNLRIPVASAILSVTDSDNYPIIDERCMQALKTLYKIEWKVITSNSWLLSILGVRFDICYQILHLH